MPTAVAVALIAAASGARAQNVRGRVLDSAKQPLNLAEVRLLPLGRQVVTSGAGTFDFEDVPPGSYTLQVRRLGFTAVTRSITVPLPTGTLTVAMRPVPVELDTVYTQILQKELPYVFQRMKEHLGAVAFGPDLMKRFPGASLDEVLEMDPALWWQLMGARNHEGGPLTPKCGVQAFIDGRKALTPLDPGLSVSGIALGLAAQVTMSDVAAVEVFDSPDFIHEPDLGDTLFLFPNLRDCKRIVLIWTKGYVQPGGVDPTGGGSPGK
jgi:Carboxypeptidase regulatory-like domain